MRWTTPLRGLRAHADIIREENTLAIGGMRNPTIAISKVSRHRAVGPLVSHAVNLFLDQQSCLQRRLLNALSSDTVAPVLTSDPLVIKARVMLSSLLGATTAPVAAVSSLQHHVWKAWATKTLDPDACSPQLTLTPAPGRYRSLP